MTKYSEGHWPLGLCFGVVVLWVVFPARSDGGYVFIGEMLRGRTGREDCRSEEGSPAIFLHGVGFASPK